MEQEIIIDGKTFSLVSVQRPGTTAVYRCGNLYLRLGAKNELERDLLLHEQMTANGFPVAKILSKGEYKNYLYFIEESLGEKHFGDLFAEDIKNTGNISNSLFETFLKITNEFATAQLKTAGQRGSVDEFFEGICLATLCKELPEYAMRIEKRFSEAMTHLASFPFVLTHGDFNPHNLYPTGVIDLEDSFFGPAGYDLITNLVHINYFPPSSDYEFFQEYIFNDDQKQRYLDVVDTLYQSKGLPALSPCLPDFEFCRAVWSAVKIEKYPKLQKFRYDLLQEKFLKVSS